jgi:hypothetical protein
MKNTDLHAIALQAMKYPMKETYIGNAVPSATPNVTVENVWLLTNAIVIFHT